MKRPSLTSWIFIGMAAGIAVGFAAPHVAGVAALVLAKHPELTPYQLKSVLHLTATNAGGER